MGEEDPWVPVSSVKLHFMGANQQVTGSRYCLDTGRSRVMVDCGMFQERQFASRNWRRCPIPPETLHALLLTHAHIDHCGLIPRLVGDGFRSPIYTTAATADLLEVMLRDAAHIQAEDLEYKRKRHKKEGRLTPDAVQPLFDDRDVDRTLPLVEPVDYEQPISITEDITVTFREAGHILGSAMLDVRLGEGDKQKRIIFSGDIGQQDKPLLHDPSVFDLADYVVMESTYGDRDHEDGGDVQQQLERVINKTISAKGNVVIPTFAVERAQDLIYHLSGLVREKRIPDIAIFLDSPMAVDVTEIFRRHRDRFDAETWNLIAQGKQPLNFPGLILSRTREQSMAINNFKQPCVIMSTSGMCTAGRIKHHLKRNVSRPESTILFVGYQAEGTLGRQILDGKREVRIHGQLWPVKAHVGQIFGFSGHADRTGLLNWLSHFQQPPRRLFLTHGDKQAANALAQQIRDRQGWSVLIPDYDSTSDL